VTKVGNHEIANDIVFTSPHLLSLGSPLHNRLEVEKILPHYYMVTTSVNFVVWEVSNLAFVLTFKRT